MSSAKKISIIRKKFSLPFLLSAINACSKNIIDGIQREGERKKEEGIFTYVKLIGVVAINIRFNVLERNFSLEEKFVWRYLPFESTLNFSLKQTKLSFDDEEKDTHKLSEDKLNNSPTKNQISIGWPCRISQMQYWESNYSYSFSFLAWSSSLCGRTVLSRKTVSLSSLRNQLAHRFSLSLNPLEFLLCSSIFFSFVGWIGVSFVFIIWNKSTYSSLERINDNRERERWRMYRKIFSEWLYKRWSFSHSWNSKQMQTFLLSLLDKIEFIIYW